VRIFGEEHPVRARIEKISGFSAHADRDELLGWISSLETPPRKVFVTHGEAKTAAAFRDFLAEKTGWTCAVTSAWRPPSPPPISMRTARSGP
jgi:metallo-beta-lactamase family protein